MGCVLLSILAGCDRLEEEIFGPPEYTYRDCLKDSFNGTHNYSAEDVRTLCEEITLSVNPTYNYTDNGLEPSDDFTRCYDKEMKSGADAELAKAICKYREAQ